MTHDMMGNTKTVKTSNSGAMIGVGTNDLLHPLSTDLPQSGYPHPRKEAGARKAAMPAEYLKAPTTIPPAGTPVSCLGEMPG